MTAQSEVDSDGDRAEPPCLQDDSLSLGVAQIVITAATPVMEEPEQPFPPPPTEEEVKASEEVIASEDTEEVDQPSVEEPSLSEDPTVAEVIEEPDDPTDSAPFPISSSTGSEEDTYTGPSTAENSQSQPAEHPKTVASNAVGEDSIPDELQPHQLAQLQDLKESNA